MDLNFNALQLGDGRSVQATVYRHHPLQGYEPNGWASQMNNGGWAMHSAPTQVTPHSRSVSDHFQTTNLTAPEPSNPYCRRLSVPTIHHTLQHNHHSQQTPRPNMEPRMLQGYPMMTQNQYQQNMSQLVNVGQLAAGPPQLTISTAHGRPISGPYSTSPPHPNQRVSPGFEPGPSFPPRVNHGNFTTPDAVHGSGRSIMDRTSRTTRSHPYPRTQQVSPTWDRRQGAGSPDDFSPIASNGRISFDGSDSATSPGADSDAYYGFPDTPGTEEFETTMKDPRKEKQKLRKQEERRKEKVQYDRVVPLLGLEKPTKADVLERIIELLNGRVPARKHEPTQALQGREEKRSERAKQVSASRNDIARLFEEVAYRLGFTDQSIPRRELILKRVADELERRLMTGTQFPGPQGGAGQGGHHWMV